GVAFRATSYPHRRHTYKGAASIAGSRFARKNRHEPFFVEHPHSQVLCFFQLRARLCARDDEVRLAADRRRDTPSCRHDFALGVLPRHRFESPGQHERLVADWAAPFDLGWRFDIEDFDQALDGLQISGLVEVLADAVRYFLPDIAHAEQIVLRGGRQRIHRLELQRQLTGGMLADVPYPKPVDKPVE